MRKLNKMSQMRTNRNTSRLGRDICLNEDKIKKITHYCMYNEHAKKACDSLYLIIYDKQRIKDCRKMDMKSQVKSHVC